MKFGLEVLRVEPGAWFPSGFTLWGYLSVIINVLLTLFVFYTVACMISRLMEKQRTITLPASDPRRFP